MKSVEAHVSRERRRSQLPKGYFHAVVGGFAGDDDIVDVALAEAGRSDAHEFAALHQRLQVFGADVAHAAAQAADELVGQRGERTLAGYTAFHARRDRFPALDFLFLSIAVGPAFFHGRRAAQTAIAPEAAAVIQKPFAV